MIADLLCRSPVVINIGMRAFAESVAAQGAEVVHIECPRSGVRSGSDVRHGSAPAAHRVRVRRWRAAR